MGAEGKNAPVTKSLRSERQSEHRHAQLGVERPAEKDHFARTGKEKDAVKNLHEAEVTAPVFPPSPHLGPSFTPSAHDELDQSLDPEQTQENEISGYRYHWSKTISEQKPGPMASIKP
jgi:hypothetical protein